MSNLIAGTVTATTAVKAGSLQDAAGANGSTPLQLQQGRAKAWLNMNGTGTIATRDSFNTSSITDNGVGDYTQTFSVAMLNANYSNGGSAGDLAAQSALIGVMVNDTYRSANSVRFKSCTTGATFDAIQVTIQTFGN